MGADQFETERERYRIETTKPTGEAKLELVDVSPCIFGVEKVN